MWWLQLLVGPGVSLAVAAVRGAGARVVVVVRHAVRRLRPWGLWVAARAPAVSIGALSPNGCGWVVGAPAVLAVTGPCVGPVRSGLVGPGGKWLGPAARLVRVLFLLRLAKLAMEWWVVRQGVARLAAGGML